MGQVTTVTIAGVVYSIYGERDVDGGTAQPSAGEYLGGSFTSSAIWAALSATQQGQCLVEATRWLDRQRWAGSKTSDAQPLQWPRTGVTRIDGSAVDSATVPDEIVFACYELAVLISQDPDLPAAQPGASGNIKRVEGGPANVEFFQPQSIAIFPLKAYDLVSQFLSGSGDVGVSISYATGTGHASSFDSDDYFGLGQP